MEIVARQLIRAIRGRRSQEAFSRRLGYSSNPVADWEAGRRFPTAAETFRACRLSGIDVVSACERFNPSEDEGGLGAADDASVAAWLAGLRGNTAIKDVASRVVESRYAVARWLGGETRPRLPEFLALVEALTNRLSDLVAELVPIESVPALLEAHRQRHASRRVAFDEPWVAAVMVLLETTAYQDLGRHVDGWIAERLEIPLEVEQRCLAQLEAAGLVSCEPGDPEGTKRLKAHWASLGAARARRLHDGDLVSYNVVAVSRDDLERIREAHVRYFMEVRSIVASSRPEVAALVNIQLLTFGPPSEQSRN
jgi:transcriptional regulator with XRE-family HTH domain